MRTVTDPNGHATVAGHDARGNVVSPTTCRDADSCLPLTAVRADNSAASTDYTAGTETAVGGGTGRTGPDTDDIGRCEDGVPLLRGR